jgi:hypothetical protein
LRFDDLAEACFLGIAYLRKIDPQDSTATAIAPADKKEERSTL